METTQKNQFTDEEKELARRYQVEPKLCRLISEIVREHTKEINQLIRLIQSKSKAEPGAVPAEQQKATSPSTKNEALDELIDQASYEAAVFAHGVLNIYAADTSVGERIRERLDFIYEGILLEQGKSGSGLDVEIDVLPAIKWENFLQGFMAGKNLVRT